MADCGAAGTVLDRAARSILFNSSNGDSKQLISSLIGHAGRSSVSGSLTTVPLHAPDSILLNNQMTAQTNQPLDLQIHQKIQNQGFSQFEAVPTHPSMRHAQERMQFDEIRFRNQVMMQQQQHAFIRHQHEMMAAQQMQQHHNTMIHLQAKELNDSKFRNETNVPRDSHKVDVIPGHDGIVQDVDFGALKESWYEVSQQDDLQTASSEKDGLVQNIDIRELAAAWDDANYEYQSLFDQFDNNVLTEHDDVQDALTPYNFFNKLADEPSLLDDPNWMEEGMRNFNMGNIKEAIRAFEMEIQQVDPDSATAWRMLGRCHAENDMDKDAIFCLEHAVDRDPYCSEALLALGVSYVNELNHLKALECLKAWITHNPSFASIEFDADVYGSDKGETEVKGVEESSFDEVQRLLLQTLERVVDTNSGIDVADVLEALGVVYNVSRDYDAAVNSLRKALEKKPDDYQLWNKLGATLANSNQSSEALPAYHKALQLKPKYARAWLNMAISHSNLQNYDEAARCYLQTLSLNPEAIHCWSYLRIALSCSERWDLIPLAAAQDLEAFREHFDFMTYNS